MSGRPSRTMGAIAGAGTALALWAAWFLLLAGPGGREPRVVDILPNSTTAVIGRQLKAAGVIRHATLFKLAVHATGSGRKLKAGEYAFPPAEGLLAVIQRVASGRVLGHPFTVPEGFTARQIADALQAQTLGSADAFLRLVNDPVLAKSLGVPGPALEGFLFPDTYELYKGEDPRLIVQRMVERFRKKVKPEIFTAGKALGLAEWQVVTLGSMIEREAEKSSEQPVISSVFHNRLQKKMRLESCSTVLYSLGRIGGDVSLDDVNTPSPYNTYLHRGLPPGPIGNPGITALDAAVHPAKTDYLFFVVGTEGQHVFSVDYAAHLKAKAALDQQRRRERRERPAAEE